MVDTIVGTTTYRNVRLIAEGGMGSVSEALQDGAEGFYKTVAIKTIRNRYAADAEFVRLFIGEAKLVADLVHENIVQVYNLGRTDNQYYIVMEYVEGITLEMFIQEHLRRSIPIPLDLGAFIISRVCRGLEYAHHKVGRDGNELGIVHRDISPKNVLLNFEGVVKITDFGIAKAREVMEQNDAILMGRLEYMAPEQARREPTDGRSDIYSVGVLTYETLTGATPPRGLGSLIRLHGLNMAFPRPIETLRDDVPSDLGIIINKALQPELTDRFQTAAEMGFALEYHLYHEGYGPTNVTLRDYLKEHFTQNAPSSPPTAYSDNKTAKVVEHRADTIFGTKLD